MHGGGTRSTADNQLYELYDFSVTLTARVTISIDRVGDQLVARNVSRTLANKQGFNAKVEQLRALLHMNWNMVVMQGKTPPSANDNLSNWLSGTVYGFCEPARYRGPEESKFVGPAHFSADLDSDDFGIKAEMRFEGAKRFQAQTAAVGPFA